MNLSSIKKQVRLALENSNCASRYVNLVESRKKSMIAAAAKRVKEDGITVEQATQFANNPATFQFDLDSRRIEDYGQIRKRDSQLRTHWQRHRMARVGKTHTAVMQPYVKVRRETDNPATLVEFN